VTSLHTSDASKAKPRAELGVRLVSAAVLGGVALIALVTSLWTFVALVVLAGVTLAWEWGRLVRKRAFDLAFYAHAMAIATVAIFAALQRPGLALGAGAVGATVIAFASPNRATAVWSVAGLLCTALATYILVWLRASESLGVVAVLYLLVVAWATDTGSYLGGRTLGGPKLAPRVSPQKTWSGLLVGILVGTLIGSMFATMLDATSALWLAGQTLLLAAMCQFGDLVESATKRHFDTKDTSRLIPGHGGLLDRLDSLLAATLAAGLIVALRPEADPAQALLIW
jgi:phosphatidate cytidylyltransferase